jgi:hypothetical protein
MKALSWITAIILVGILPFNGWARLGETPEQCEDRYGPPSITKKDPAGFLPGVTLSVYQKAGLAISVIFYRGSAGFVVFEKSEKNALGNMDELSVTEIEALLKANAGGKEWLVARPAIRGPLGDAWELEDGSATAEYVNGPNRFKHRLVVQTAEYLAASRAAERAKDEENLNGF